LVNGNSKYNRNCYKHANFVNQEDISNDEDPEDDIPLAKLSQLQLDQINVQEYVNIDQNVPACEKMTDDNLISEFKMARNQTLDEPADDIDDDGPEVKPPPSLSCVFEAFATLDEYVVSEENSEEDMVLLCKLRKNFIQRDFQK